MYCHVLPLGLVLQLIFATVLSDLHLDIGNRVSLDKVVKFSYLRDRLDADGGCDSAVTARVRSAWKKIREYLPCLCHMLEKDSR